MRAMVKKLLAGADIVANWTSLAGALEGALRFLGEQVTTPWVMGVSGHAFRLALRIDAGEVAAPGAETAIDLKSAAARYRSLGRTFDVVVARAGAKDWAKRRDEVIRAAHKCIDHGAPALVYDLHLPQFGLVKGYDDKAGVWYVSSMVSAQYGETLPLSRWPVPERPDAVLALLPAGRVRVHPQAAVRDALRFAVLYAGQGEPDDGSGALHGLAALARWRDAFVRGEPIATTGNAILIQMLQSARRDAAAFLRRDGMRLLPDAGEALARAAAAYDAEVLALSRMMTMFPFPSGGDPTNAAARVVAASALREAAVREEEAIAAVQQALA